MCVLFFDDSSSPYNRHCVFNGVHVLFIAGLMAFIFFIDGYQTLIPVARFKEFIVEERPALHFSWVPVVVSLGYIPVVDYKPRFNCCWILPCRR